jgi:putative transcriptional regulator
VIALAFELDEILRLLSLRDYKFSVITYPDTNRRSIDIIVEGYKQRRFLIRVPTERVGKDEIKDLKKIASATESAALVVTEDAEEDIVNRIDKVYGVSPYALERALDGDKLYIYKTRGGIFIKIKHEILKEKREEMGLSIGELAKSLGVSRQAIYDYEKGDSDVTVEVAEKLLEIFGEDIIGNVFDDTCSQDVIEDDIGSHDNTKAKISASLKKKGFNVVNLKLAPADIIATTEKRRLVISIEPKDSNKAFKKFYDAKKLTLHMNGDLVIVARTNKVSNESKTEGFKTTSNLELADVLNDEEG